MSIKDSFFYINIRDYLALGDDKEAGEPALVKLLSGFSCPKNLAYLIAQLGKNYTNGVNNKITGKELVELAWTVIEDAQYMLGGIVTFLEAENEEKLLAFYRDNRFSRFDTRQTASDKDETHELIQLLRLI